ncbi:MAG: hypothetical protein KGO81_13110 [Bacteroidota bacterium]|nr:hypothetical protein [Bacteroidota bacterium]
MSAHFIIRGLLILFVIAINVISIMQGFFYGSALAVWLATGSLVALLICIHLLKKLESVEQENEQK